MYLFNSKEKSGKDKYEIVSTQMWEKVGRVGRGISKLVFLFLSWDVVHRWYCYSLNATRFIISNISSVLNKNTHMFSTWTAIWGILPQTHCEILSLGRQGSGLSLTIKPWGTGQLQVTRGKALCNFGNKTEWSKVYEASCGAPALWWYISHKFAFFP